jgi:hypothetical protein
MSMTCRTFRILFSTYVTSNYCPQYSTLICGSGLRWTKSLKLGNINLEPPSSYVRGLMGQFQRLSRTVEVEDFLQQFESLVRRAIPQLGGRISRLYRKIQKGSVPGSSIDLTVPASGQPGQGNSQAPSTAKPSNRPEPPVSGGMLRYFFERVHG